MYLRDGSAQTILHAATLEIEVADPTFYLSQSQYTDTGPTSPSADPITPGAWQGSHWSANFEVTGMTRPRKKSGRKRDSNPGSSALEADAIPLGQRGGISKHTLKWPGRNRVQITCNFSGAYHVQHLVCHVVRRYSTAIKFDRL